MSTPDSTSEPVVGHRSPLLARRGAVAADGVDAGVAAHYGDPMREQRDLVAGRGMVDLSHREVVTVTGPDRLSWLHSLTTQHLSALPAGVATQTLVLSPHGHVEHALDLVDDGTTVWAHVERGSAAALVAFLEKMRFMLRVEVEDVTDDWAVVALPETAPVPEVLAAAPGPTRLVPGWRERFVPRDLLEPVADAAGPLAGTWAHEALRIADGRPRTGLEADHRTIVHELGLVPAAVHLDKGCYRGQETVARVQNLGRPPRRLVLLHLDGSVDVLPRPGDEVALGERVVGRVTSAARHHELGPIALAVVKRATDPAAELVVRSADSPVAAAQEVLVPV